MNLERAIFSRLGGPYITRGILADSCGFRRNLVVGGRKVLIQWRDPQNPLGRFGGGWQYEAGIQIGGSTVIVNLGVFSVRIDRRRRKNGNS